MTPGYHPPTVEDANGTPQDWSLARVDVPPPAPSPPPADVPNVFDFLVEEKTPSRPQSLRSSVSASSSPRLGYKALPSPKKRVHMDERVIEYGHAPIEQSNVKYDSNLSLAMDVDSQHTLPGSSLHRTPAAKSSKEDKHADKKASKSGSEKKRKRPPVEELDLSESRKSSQELEEEGAPVLHSGLTGGLAKLLGKNGDSQVDAPSPLSPKKRHKRERHETDSADGDRVKHSRSRKHGDGDDGGQKRKHKRHRSDGDEIPKSLKALEPAAEIKTIEYHKHSGNGESHALTRVTSTATASSSRQEFRSHSEFFLSLIDKGHASHKGQSIWGTLKSFHDGMCEEEEKEAYEGSGVRVREEKRLMKALRMKINRQGEIVLFARPDFEVAMDEGHEKEREVRRIEAA